MQAVRESNVMDPLSQSLRLNLVSPISWVHVPKCGTSFINTLFRHRGICPNFDDHYLISRAKTGLPDEVQAALDSNRGLAAVDLSAFYAEHYKDLPQWCPGLDSQVQGFGHKGVEGNWPRLAGHSAIMVRQPQQRIISAYNHGRHLCPWCNKSTTLAEYAAVARGCTTRMLTRDGSPCVNSSLPTAAESELAVQRLRSGFAFVGLTEEWNLSMCLFHARFGGECTALELLNTRPGKHRDAEHPDFYDIEELQGIEDPYDSLLYAEAKEIFWQDVNRFGLTVEKCRQMCTPAASA